MTHEHAKIICSKKKNNHPLPGRMASGVIRRAISKLTSDLTNKKLKFTGPQKYRLYMALESWRQELKIIELETLQAEEILEVPEVEDVPTNSIDMDIRSPFFGQ